MPIRETARHEREVALRRRRSDLAAACLPAAMITLPGAEPDAWARRALDAADALLAAEDAAG